MKLPRTGRGNYKIRKGLALFVQEEFSLKKQLWTILTVLVKSAMFFIVAAILLRVVFYIGQSVLVPITRWIFYGL